MLKKLSIFLHLYSLLLISRTSGIKFNHMTDGCVQSRPEVHDWWVCVDKIWFVFPGWWLPFYSLWLQGDSCPERLDVDAPRSTDPLPWRTKGDQWHKVHHDLLRRPIDARPSVLTVLPLDHRWVKQETLDHMKSAQFSPGIVTRGFRLLTGSII